MAAGSRANEEQFDRHTIDRFGVVSKYVGKTEKRLNKIFFKAWPNNLMLFFDGADVLLGKRSTVKATRDRSGNSHLLREKGRLVQNVLEFYRATR